MRNCIILWFAAMSASSVSFANCGGWAAGVSGQIKYIGSVMKYCDGTNWLPIGLPSCSGNLITAKWSALSNSWVCGGSTPASCKAILNAGGSHGNGSYTIDPGTGDMTVYCDMTVDGGGWTLVVSHNTGVTPVSRKSVTPNSGTFMSNTLYQALNANATEYLFYTSNPGTYYYKMPKTWASTANCQNMTTANPNPIYPTEFVYGWNDPGCNGAGGDYSGVDYADTEFFFGAQQGSPGSYSATGTPGSWIVPYPYFYITINGASDYLMGFVR